MLIRAFILAHIIILVGGKSEAHAAGEAASLSDKAAVAEPASTRNQEPAKPEALGAAVLLERAAAMMESPDDFTPEEWSDLSRKIHGALPGIVQNQQRLKRKLVQVRQAGRKDPSLQSLLQQREELDRAIKEAIEALPKVQEIKQKISNSHEELMDTIQMRTKIQRFVQEDHAGKVTQANKTQQE